MDLHDIVDDAHALASSIESGEIDEAVFRAGRIAAVAAVDEALGIVLAAYRVIAVLATPDHRESELGGALTALARTIENCMESSPGSTPKLTRDCSQRNRRGNLRAALDELKDEGISALQDQASVLHVNGAFLETMLNGGYISDIFARELEWVMQRRTGWMDEERQTRNL
ncbi:hypothetical protein [Luteibacter aegosomatissinici]|uniref:hypothetical protein n=1 Tax=Luteibacter aegosomatissinici TaxID=2911539 RepID=UPI001FF7E2E9|nr:hypothetical protein [Luteibacter aegosomatissinici]UPG92766.1 hypothetical protein L2Y97_12915 [Luteibacter aegosomatissinici]